MVLSYFSDIENAKELLQQYGADAAKKEPGSEILNHRDLKGVYYTEKMMGLDGYEQRVIKTERGILCRKAKSYYENAHAQVYAPY